MTFHFLEIYFADAVFIGIQSFSGLPNYFIVRHTKIEFMENWHTLKKMLLFKNKTPVLLLIYNFFILSLDLVSLNTIRGLDFFRCLQILESHLQQETAQEASYSLVTNDKCVFIAFSLFNIYSFLDIINWNRNNSAPLNCNSKFWSLYSRSPFF